MDLETFVGTAIAQIVRGVVSAQKSVEGTGALVNPSGFSLPGSDDAGSFNIRDDYGLDRLVRSVEFDVAVTIGNVQGAEGAGHIQVLGLSLGGGGNVTYENSSISRVKFLVPLSLPTVHSEKEKERASRMNNEFGARP